MDVDGEVGHMVAVRDVAAYIEQRMPGVTDMQLFKLTYYAQAWHLAWEGTTLFPDRLEAWRYGPVPADYRAERTYGLASPAPRPLDEATRAVVDSILDHYGSMSAAQLARLSHAEDPWRAARGDLPEDARSSAEITPASMRRYYTRLSVMGRPVPRRRGVMASPPRAAVETIAAAEVVKWSDTLSWLADR